MSPLSLSLLSQGGLLSVVVRCSQEEEEKEERWGCEEGGYHRHTVEPNADPLYTERSLARLAHPWPWLAEQPHSGWH